MPSPIHTVLVPEPAATAPTVDGRVKGGEAAFGPGKASSEVLSWLPADRSPRIERAFVVARPDLLSIWQAAKGEHIAPRLYGPNTGTGDHFDRSLERMPDAALITIVEATSQGIGIQHPQLVTKQQERRPSLCIPAPADERSGVLALFDGASGTLIGALPFAESDAAVSALIDALNRTSQSLQTGAPAPSAQTSMTTTAGGADVSEPTFRVTHVQTNIFWSIELITETVIVEHMKRSDRVLTELLAVIDDPAFPDLPEVTAATGNSIYGTVERVASVETPTGTQRDCWLITSVSSAANSDATWYCRGAGIIRREEPGCGSGNPYGSYSIFELVDSAQPNVAPLGARH